MKTLQIRKFIMEAVHVIMCVIVYVSIFVTVVCLIFVGMPRFMDWIDMNLCKNYLENRAEKKVKDLKMKLRIMNLEEEAEMLQRKLESYDD